MPAGIANGYAEDLFVEYREVEKIAAHDLRRLRACGNFVSGDERRAVGQETLLYYRSLLYVTFHRVDMELKVQLGANRIQTEFDFIPHPATFEGERENPLAVRILDDKRRRRSVSSLQAGLFVDGHRRIVVDVRSILNHQPDGF